MWTFVVLLMTLGLAQSQKKNLEDFEDFVIGSCCGVEAFYPDGKLDVTKLEGWVMQDQESKPLICSFPGDKTN